MDEHATAIDTTVIRRGIFQSLSSVVEHRSERICREILPKAVWAVRRAMESRRSKRVGRTGRVNTLTHLLSGYLFKRSHNKFKTWNRSVNETHHQSRLIVSMLDGGFTSIMVDYSTWSGAMARRSANPPNPRQHIPCSSPIFVCAPFVPRTIMIVDSSSRSFLPTGKEQRDDQEPNKSLSL